VLFAGIRQRRSQPSHPRSQGINRHHTWRRRLSAGILQIVSYALTLALAALVIWTFAIVVIGAKVAVPALERRCQNHSFSCAVLAGISVPLLSLAGASAVFLFFRLSRVRRRYRRRARKHPRELVPTAGRILERVVGRDELCYVIMDNLADIQTRQAFIIVGGVGVGKTAVLVQLTRLLADARAVPVPIMLREAQTESELDFRALANRKFMADVAGPLLYEGEDQRAWRQLRRDGRIVVLADGLEEALIDNDQRNNIIRLAIERANRQKLPLVIASRPHDPLRNTAAAIIELEPLSEEAALFYLTSGSRKKAHGETGSSVDRLDWIVETAQVVEEPLYLQITRDLHKNGLLEHPSPGSGSPALDTRDADRTTLRLHLLDAWTEALKLGYLPEGLAMSPQDRLVAVEAAAALACVGLKLDSVDVKFADLLGPPPKDAHHVADGAGDPSAAPAADPRRPRPAPLRRRLTARRAGERATPDGQGETRELRLRPLTRTSPHEGIMELMSRRLSGAQPDIQVAVAWGERLGIVELRGGGVRFPHSLIQAYLGSLMMSAALHDDTYCREAAQKPGREFLIAVVMYFCSRRAQAAERHAEDGNDDSLPSWEEDVRSILSLLKESARVQDVNAKKLDVYAAALEIDSANAGLQHPDIAAELLECWPHTTVTYDRPLEEAKLGLVRRFGEAVRKVGTKTGPAAASADHAHDGVPGASSGHAPAYQQLYDIAVKEESYPVRLAVAQEIAAGGEEAFEHLQDRLVATPKNLGDAETAHSPADKAQCKWREAVLCAWLAPMLAGSASRPPGTGQPQGHVQSSTGILSEWLQRLGKGSARPEDASLPVSLEIALAQGFKYAANRQRHYPGTRSDTRDWLADQATEMLKRTRFWFTHLTLLHALCLWNLRDDEDPEPVAGGHGSQPEAIVRQWLSIAGTETADGRRTHPETTHPFVTEAGELVVLALREQRPEKYIWIDESGVIGIVGSHAEGPRTGRKHNLWIPPSTGWSVLHPRARNLVADVLVLLNLAERGDRPEDHDRRLKFTDRPDLPPCLTEDRSFLNPTQPVTANAPSTPGANCRDDCRFRLCPYPPFGGPSYRVELNEPFCRNQQAILGRLSRARAPWQEMNVPALRKSWVLMAERSRDADGPRRT